MSGGETIVWLVQIWLTAGAVVAALFLIVGIDQIDDDARGAYVFRPLLVPAVLLIWPLVLWRWFVLETGRDQWAARHRPPRRQHLVVAVGMALLISFSMIAGLSARQIWPGEIAPQQLTPPAGTEE